MSVSQENLEAALSRIALLEAKVAELEETHGLEWVRLEKWCTLTGDTKDAVYSRRHAGKWADGVHCELRDGRLWVNYREAVKWRKKNPSISRVA